MSVLGMQRVASGSAAFAGRRSVVRVSSTRGSSTIVRAAANRKTFFPGSAIPEYLDGSLAGDYGWDPLALGAKPETLNWYRQAELVHARWAMLAVAGILVQEIFRPEVFWYEAGLPQNLPGPFKNINLGGLLAFEFLLMHWVEVRRWQDLKAHHSVDVDPIFTNNKVPNEQQGYPGGIFDPLGFSKGGNLFDLQTKEVKNGRLAMVAFVGFVFAAQTTGKGPLGALGAHLSAPFSSNILKNIGHCVTPGEVDVQGLRIPLTCLWPAQH